MFTQNIYEPILLSEYHIENEYFLLYYQLRKHAFGLEYCNVDSEKINIHLLLDDMPNSLNKVLSFKSYICDMSNLSSFKKAQVEIVPENISDVKSHNPPILQGLDVIMGAMQFRLNNLHKDKPINQRFRGKRTRAKEIVYKHINKKIRELIPKFNIGVTTSCDSWPTDLWNQSYRHWKFVPKNHKVNLNKSKRAP